MCIGENFSRNPEIFLRKSLKGERFENPLLSHCDFSSIEVDP
jgi:hypothetical protein